MSATLSSELRFLRLERRVERIERQLGLNDVPVAEPPPAPAPAAPMPAAPMPATPRVVPPPLPVTPTEVALPPRIEPLRYAAHPEAKATADKRAQTRSPRQLEQTIGLKWAGWIGAVVLVIGAALGVKYAYDHHWFGNLSETARLAIIVSAGFALIGAGEFVLRRIHAVPAASLFGAGIATLFVAAYVGQEYYHLYSRTSAEVAMTLATLVGAAVAMRGNMLSIAVLALIGGNVAPIVLRHEQAATLSFLAYLFMLQLVALVLTSWGTGGKWWTLRSLSLATTALWVAALMPRTQDAPILVSAMLFYAALYHVEVIITTLRRDTTRQAAPGVTFSLFVTAALTCGVLWYYLDAPRLLRGEWVAGIAIVCATLGFTLPRIKSSLAALGYAHRIAAVALVVLSVPISLAGADIVIGWMILSVALSLAWLATGSIVSRYASIVTWLLAGMRLAYLVMAACIDLRGAPEPQVWMSLLDTPIVSYAVLAWILSISGFVMCRLIVARPRGLNVDRDVNAGEWLHGARMLCVVAAAIWVAAAIIYLPPLGATFVILLGAWLLMLVGHPLAPQLAPMMHALAMLVLAAVKWALIDALAARLSPAWSAAQYTPVLNPLMATGAAIAASFAAMYFLSARSLFKQANRDESRAPSLLSLVALMISVFTIGLAFEIDRVVEQAALRHALAWPLWQLKNMSWTMLWSASVLSIAFAGTRILDAAGRRRLLSWIWILPGLLVVKYVVIDTLISGGSHPIGRISPLLNIQALTGLVVFVSLMLMRMLMNHDDAETSTRRLRDQLGAVALLVVVWMGTLEIGRAVDWYGVARPIAWHVKALFLSMWWMTCAAGTFAVKRRLELDAPNDATWHRLLPTCIFFVALKYLVFDTIIWRIAHAPLNIAILANVEALAAAVVLAGLAVLWVMDLPASTSDRRRARLRNVVASYAVLVVLWAGTIEIDRAFWLPTIRSALADPELAEQVGLSIFWSVFAVSTVVFGFVLRTARLRYFGLTLLALTLLKVVVVDLRGVDTGYRILSFLGLGLLLLGTSVVYGKVSPKLLREAIAVS